MKLLIVTQKVDLRDDNLSFFHGWLEKFSAKIDKIYVISLAGGSFNLPSNVIVYSLGKEKGYGKIRQLFRLQRFLFKSLPQVDGVFVHMCPIYAVASFPLVKLFRKKMILWFTHKSVTWELKLASKLVDKILTASKESCRLENREKIEITGHGININQFQPNNSARDSSKFMILSAGRIVPAKGFHVLIEAADILVNQKSFRDFKIKILGTPVLNSEKQYLAGLEKAVQEKGLSDYVQFLPGVPHKKLPGYYQATDLFVNLSYTGSIDKVVLEAMASGCLVLTCNEAFESILNSRYSFKKNNQQDLAEKIINLRKAGKDGSLREIVVSRHNLDKLIDKICREF